MENSRSCPSCQQPLQTRRSEGVEVDLCGRCGGLWLDKGEFDTLIAQRFAGEGLEDDLVTSSHPPTYCRACDREAHRLEVEAPEDTHCSHCLAPLAKPCPVDATPMDVLEVVGLELERCRECQGFWLDATARHGLARGKEKLRELAHELHQNMTLESEKPFQDFLVDCANCGARVEVEKCVARAGLHFCEACVVKGQYAGSDGRKTAVQHAAATQEARERRAANGEPLDALDAIGGRGGGRVTDSWSVAVGRSLGWLSGLFGREAAAVDEDEEEIERAFLERKRRWEENNNNKT